MTDRENRAEIAFWELANGDSADPFTDGWDACEEEE